MRRLLALSFASCLAVTVAAFGQGAYKVQPIQGPPAGDVSAAVQGALQPQGERFLDGSGKALCEVWLVKELPAAQNPSSSPTVLYGKVAPGSLVGVIHFADQTTDYRGQTIKSGFYTLRYQLIPEDGNHMGVSQYRDFLLLVPAAQDPGGSQALSFDQAVQLSRKVTGTGHPGVLMMDAVSDSDKTFPDAFQDYSQNWALQVQTQLAGGASLPIAFVLVGKYAG